jgi:AP-1-like factor
MDTNIIEKKRKAQNRAAQRAFRERKEKHLKDLETKVSELTKSQEADKHENGLLKAQIERLHIELREYRKRLSLNGGSGANRSPPLTASGQSRSNTNPSYSTGNFQFDFPKFGALPGSQIFGNSFSNGSNSSSGNRTSATPPLVQSPTGSISGPSQPQTVSSRDNSIAARSMSPKSLSGSNTNSPGQISSLNPSFAPYSTNSNMHGFASTLPQMSNPTNDPFGDLFSPSILKGTSVENTGAYFGGNTRVNGGVSLNGVSDLNGGDSTAGLKRVFQFNGGSTSSDTASPSASSASQWNANANSSCGTSPEPSHDSPGAQKPKNAETFCDKIDPRKNSTDVTVNQINNIQFTNGDYSVPSLDSFDPVLFGDYRESNDAIVGGGDFTGGFFDEALNPVPFDYASPTSLFGILQSPQQTHTSLTVSSTGAVNAPSPSKNLMADMDKIRDGGDDDYGLPSAQPQQMKSDTSGKLISCNSIW